MTADTAWARHIDYLWTPRQVRKILADVPGLKPQPKLEQSRFKLSYYIDPEIADIEEIKQRLHQEEQSVYVQTAFGQFLDILPLRASKGLALRYVVERLSIPLEAVFVAGGSGADEDMMRGNTLAAVVATGMMEELPSSPTSSGSTFLSSRMPPESLRRSIIMISSANAAIRMRHSAIMPMTKLLLCTDLDRTLLPNGEPPEHPDARSLFGKLCAHPEVTLTYVSGRHLRLVEEAINEYAIPRPDYVISDVGTKIYQADLDDWQELSSWQQQIAGDWRGKVGNCCIGFLTSIPNWPCKRRQNRISSN